MSMSRTMNKICLATCILLIIAASAITISATLTTSQVIGSDFYFHLNIAEFLAKGDLNGAYNFTIVNNQFPYALFAFHALVLTPTIWLGQPMLIARILQTILMPLTYALTLGVAYKYAGPKAAALTGFTLLGCWSFLDGAIQVRPESLDLLLYPIIVYALLKPKKKTFAFAAALTIFSHGLAALANIYGLAIHKLRDKRWRKTILITLLIILPVIIMSLFYIGGAFSKWGGMPRNENPQEYDFWHNPIFIPYYMGATILGIPFLFKRNKTEFETLLTWGLVASIIMMPLWADRWLHYISIPLALLAGAGISKLNPTKQVLLATITIMIFIVYYNNILGVSALHLWWQPGM